MSVKTVEIVDIGQVYVLKTFLLLSHRQYRCLKITRKPDRFVCRRKYFHRLFYAVTMKSISLKLGIFVNCVMLILPAQTEIFNVIIPIKTNFSCLNKNAGFYADTEAACKVYHMCNEHGSLFTYRCPEDTAFRQDALICDHAHLVNCHGHASAKEKNHIQSQRNVNFSNIINSQTYNHAPTLNKPHNERNRQTQHGLGCTMRSQKSLNSFNGTGTLRQKETNLFSPLKNNNGTPIIPANHITTQPPTQMLKQQRVQNIFLKMSGDTSTQSNARVYAVSKPAEKQNSDQNGQTNHKGSPEGYNIQKPQLNTFTKNVEWRMKPFDNILGVPSANYRDNAYLETLRSIQENDKVTISPKSSNNTISTTEIPLFALTLSLKPLVPAEIENDPYYPKISTTTERFYSSKYNMRPSLFTKTSNQVTNTAVAFELPSVLPDLNLLQDIIDRKGLLYIPSSKFK